MGYGFIEYSSLKLLNEALKQLQHSELQGHQLELKRSERTLKSRLKKFSFGKIFKEKMFFYSLVNKPKQLNGNIK
jgi:hypothetical protein